MTAFQIAAFKDSYAHEHRQLAHEKQHDNQYIEGGARLPTLDLNILNQQWFM